MNEWFGFWIFLSVATICISLVSLIAYNWQLKRERWIVGQGYCYDEKRRIWVKTVEELNK